MEDQMQGLLLPELKELLPEEYDNRIKRKGITNAWDDVKLIQILGEKIIPTFGEFD